MVRPNDNSGVLYRNKSKKRDTQPDYQGAVVVGGHDYDISGWLREGTDGVKYLALAFKGKAAKPPYHAPRTAYPGQPAKTAPVDREPGSDDDKSEDIPT